MTVWRSSGQGDPHDVAHDVATGGERRQQRAVDAVDQLVQLTFVHDVELHALARGQAHRAVGQVGQPVEGEPLLGAELAAGHRGPDHAGVVEPQLLLGPPRRTSRSSCWSIPWNFNSTWLSPPNASVPSPSSSGSSPRRNPLARLMSSTPTGYCPPTGAATGVTWRPHSDFPLPAQRPERGSSPGATGRVHGQHPIEG